MVKRFLGDRSGNFAMMMGIMTLPLLLAIGFGVDYARYVSARQHLQEITDAASLAVAASTERNDGKLRALAADMISVNTSVNRIHNVSVSALDIDDDQVDLSLVGNIPTFFMGLVNINRLDVNTSALAIRAVTGSVEVALVLDNTESMNYDNKITTLKSAATNLVSQLHKNEGGNVRIALVPYAEQINVGMKNRGASWLSVPADYTNTVTTTTTTEGYWHQPTKSNGVCKTWKEAGSRQVEKDGVWFTETWPRSCSAYEQVNNGPAVWIEPKTTTKTTVTNYKWYGCVGARVSSKKLLLDDLSPSVPYPGYVATSQKCLTEIIPLTDNQNVIQSGIAGMKTSQPGYVPQTYIPGGLMWGINVLSKSAPYSEGLDYDPENTQPRKVIVLMTDGLNTRRIALTGTLNLDYLNGGTFVGDSVSANAAQRIETNTDTTKLCNYAKSKNIEIFSVAFMVDDAAAKTMLQGCATDASHYFDASDSTKMLDAFSKIARSLTQVRLAR